MVRKSGKYLAPMRIALLFLLALLFHPITTSAQQWNWAVSAGDGGNIDFVLWHSDR